VAGRLIDLNGKPVQNAYAYAMSDRTVRGVPEYVSAWTGESGEYTLFLPPGRYFVGAGTVFPPPPGTVAERELILDPDKKSQVQDLMFAPEQPQRMEPPGIADHKSVTPD
jgi:hypothetical protein